MPPRLLGIMNWPIDLDMIYILWVSMGHCELPIWIPTIGRKSYPYMGLPKMGVPLNHPSLFGIFHYQPTILGYNHQFYFGFSSVNHPSWGVHH